MCKQFVPRTNDDFAHYPLNCRIVFLQYVNVAKIDIIYSRDKNNSLFALLITIWNR